LDQIKGAADGKKSITHLDANAEDLFVGNIQRKDRGASSRDEPLKASIMAMEKSRTDNLGFFRENANLAIVIMSDEDTLDTLSLGLSHYGKMKNTPPALMNLDESEKQTIIKAMQHYDGNVLEAAEFLGVSKSAFYRRLEKFALDPKDMEK
jgi:DNA-binding NtrC family response regulator